jgi:ferritin-like metal-binding protein YciE
MPVSPIESQLIDYLEDAHALEQLVEKTLESFIRLSEAPEVLEPLTYHLEETKRHKRLLEERLAAHDAKPAKVKDAGMTFAALGKGLVDRMRSDNAGKIARDGFVAEHLEIASYELLERVAARAGDNETADVARRNRADEEAMAKKIAALWDLAVDLSLKQEGLDGAPPFPSESQAGTATDSTS